MRLQGLSKVSQLQQFLLIVLLCQIAFWYLGSPGPTLLLNAESNLLSALKTIATSVVFLLIIPILWLLLNRFDLKEVGFSIGDSRFGLARVFLFSLVAIPVLFFATQSKSLQLIYPWSGAWAGETITQLSQWIVLYGIYYTCYEFFYRGFVLKAGEQFFTPQMCMYLQVMFSVMIHLGKPLPETLGAIPAGFVFGWLALRTKSLIYPILLHLLIGVITDVSSLYHQDLFLFFR